MRDYKLTSTYIIRRPQFSYTTESLENQQLYSTAEFNEAIFYCSEDLYSQYQKYLSESLSEKDTIRMRNTLFKYLTRMLFRCTPFGSFALCGTGSYGEHIQIPLPDNFTRKFNFDIGFIQQIYFEYIEQCNIKDLLDISVIQNQTILIINNKAHLYSRDSSGEFHPATIIITPLLRHILNHTNKPIQISSVISVLKKKFEVEDAKLCQYIKKLILNGILISNLDIETIGCNNLKKLNDFIIPKEINSNLKNLIIRLYSYISEINNIDDRESIISRIMYIKKYLKEMNNSTCTNSIMHVDCYLNMKAILPYSTIKTIKHAFKAMLSCTIGDYDLMTNFKRRYLQRYENRSMPLLEVLNNSIGIGYDTTQQKTSELLIGIKSSTKSINTPYYLNVSLSQYEQIILHKFENLNLSSVSIIFLEQKDFIWNNIDELKKHLDITTSKLPISLACMFKIIGYNQNGPILSNMHFSGQSGACMLTRFASDQTEISQIVDDIVSAESNLCKNKCILAEISHLTHPKYGNVQIRPNMREYDIPFISFPNPNIGRTHIELKDIYIKIENNKIVLFSKKFGTKITPCFTSAYNPHYKSSQIYRFLYDVQCQNQIPNLQVSIDNLLKLYSYIPRIMFENLVLTPATWRINVETLKRNGQYSIDLFKEWHNSKCKTRFLCMNNGDNFIIADILSDSSIYSLFNEIKNNLSIILTEFLPLSPDISHYSSVFEIIQPITATSKSK